MQKYTVLIVDDDLENANLLKIYLTKYARCIDNIYIASSANEAVESYLEHYQDILLLDIELENNTNSFQIIEALPNINAEIIFVTSHREYAIQAINNVKTAGYLLKPVKISELVVAIDKAVNNIKNKDIAQNSVSNTETHYPELVAIPSSNKIDLVHRDDIVYIEADGRYAIFHLTNGNHKIASRNLGEFEKQLDPKMFFRIHHSYLVNLSMVLNINKSAGNYCELLNGKALPIAKRRQEQLHRFLKIK